MKWPAPIIAIIICTSIIACKKLPNKTIESNINFVDQPQDVVKQNVEDVKWRLVKRLSGWGSDEFVNDAIFYTFWNCGKYTIEENGKKKRYKYDWVESDDSHWKNMIRTIRRVGTPPFVKARHLDMVPSHIVNDSLYISFNAFDAGGLVFVKAN